MVNGGTSTYWFPDAIVPRKTNQFGFAAIVFSAMAVVGAAK